MSKNFSGAKNLSFEFRDETGDLFPFANGQKIYIAFAIFRFDPHIYLRAEENLRIA